MTQKSALPVPASSSPQSHPAPAAVAFPRAEA